MAKLTRRTPETIGPPANGRREVQDDDAPGLYFIVHSGGRKSWSFRYSVANGSRRKIGLGNFPKVGLAEARKLAEAQRVAVREGADPAHEKRRALREARQPRLDRPQTVGELWTLYERRTGPTRAKTTRALYACLWQRHAGPPLAAHPLSKIDRATVRLVIQDIAEASPQNANNVRILLSGMFNWAVDQELISANPIARLKAVHPAPERDRFMGDVELRTFWQALERAATQGRISGQVACALKLALLTGMRASAIAGLHATEIDRSGRTWTVPAERMKGREGKRRAHVVPLSDLAMEVLEDAFQSSDEPDLGAWTGFAFPQRGDPSRPVTRSALTQAMRRVVTTYGVRAASSDEHATVHDLRRTLRTHLTGERLGVSRDTAERVIGHAVGSRVERTYDRNAYLPAKRQALEAWAALLGEIVGRTPRPSNVVSFVA